MAQSHVCDVPDPHLVWADHRPSLHQMTVSWVGMGALCRPDMPRRGLPLETHLAHEPRPMLAVDLPAFALPQGRHAAITIRRPGLCETHNRRVQHCFIAGPRAVIITAASIPQDTADLAYGRRVAEPLNDLPGRFDRVCKMVVAFFRMSFSSAKRPSSRSNSATRAASWRLGDSELSKTEAARARKMVFQSASTEEAIWCSRHNSALLLAPESSSSTTWALNSAVNWRRCVMGPPSFGPIVS
jgi:hypothetical protein